MSENILLRRLREEEISMINFKLRNEALAHAFAYMKYDRALGKRHSENYR